MIVLELLEKQVGPKPAEILFLEGVLRSTGLGLSKDPAGAFESFFTAAEFGLPAAQYAAGRMLLNGDGTAHNQELGEALLRKSSRQDFVPAMLYLGMLLLERQHAEEGFDLFERAAKLGSPVAADQVARALEFGRGTTADSSRSLQWYLASAEGGYSHACRRLADAYTNGGLGAIPNKQEAERWATKAEKYSAEEDSDEFARYEIAACNGYKACQLMLAKIYSTGLLGIEVHKVRASFWEKQAMEQLPRGGR